MIAASREEVATNLSDSVVQTLHELYQITDDIPSFTERLIHILFRFDRGRIASQQPSAKDQRRKIDRIKTAVIRIGKALDELSESDTEFLNFGLSMRNMDMQDWSETVESEEEPQPLAKLRATHDDLLSELDNLVDEPLPEAKQDQAKQVRRTPLDQLINDIRGTFWMSDQEGEKALCYYNAAADDYEGKLFQFAVTLLDSYAPGSYFSRAALGQRIVRTIRKDK
jgi:hypothetical protein